MLLTRILEGATHVLNPFPIFCAGTLDASKRAVDNESYRPIVLSVGSPKIVKTCCKVIANSTIQNYGMFV